MQPFDARWQAGRKLHDYEIIKELDEAGPKQFIVKMTVEGDKGAEEVKYYVVGKDPLLVFRQEDYEKSASM